MANYTSLASGDWVGDAMTVWGAGGAYPGDTANQADTVTIDGETVDMDFTNLPGTVSITVSSGTLRVSSVMTAPVVTSISVSAGAYFVFETDADRTFMLDGPGTFSGTFTMDGRNNVMQFVVNSATARTITFSGTVNITGAGGKTIKTLCDGAITANPPNAVDFRVDDSTGWAVGDEIVISGVSTCEKVTLVAGTNTPFAAAFQNSYADNTRIYHITRSCRFVSANAKATWSFGSNVTVTDLSWAAFTKVFRVSWGSRSSRSTLMRNCVIAEAESYALYPDSGSWHNSCFENLIIWDVSTRAIYAGGVFDGLYCIKSLGGGGITSSKGAVIDNFEFSFLSDYCVTNGASWLTHGYAWGGYGGFLKDEGGYTYWLCDVNTGSDPGGNAASVKSLSIGVSSTVPARLYMDDCVVGTVSLTINCYYVSTNHNGVSGARVEASGVGVTTKTADTAFDDGVCDEIDPSNLIRPHTYRIVFECPPEKVGRAPTLKFKHKLATPNVRVGAVTVVLGGRRCGLTGIATGGTVTPGNTIAEHSVTFSGTTSLAGEVEVEVRVLDHSEHGQMRIGDLAVTWA